MNRVGFYWETYTTPTNGFLGVHMTTYVIWVKKNVGKKLYQHITPNDNPH